MHIYVFNNTIIYVLYMYWHTANTSFPNGPFVYSVGSWPGTKLWAMVRHQKYQNSHCLTAYPKETTPNDRTIHASQKRSHSDQRSLEHVITASFRSAFDCFFDVSDVSAFLTFTAMGEATGRLYTFTTFTWSSGSSLLSSPQNSAMEVPWRDSNKILWPRVHAFELNKPGRWNRNVSVLWKVSLICLIFCCIFLHHSLYCYSCLSILLHF